MRLAIAAILSIVSTLTLGCETPPPATETSPPASEKESAAVTPKEPAKEAPAKEAEDALKFPEPSKKRDGLGSLLYSKKSDIPDCSVEWTEAEARFGMRTLECKALKIDGPMEQVIVQLKTFEGKITQVATSKQGMELTKAEALLVTLKKERETLGCKPTSTKAGMQIYSCGDYQVILGLVKQEAIASVVRSYIPGDEAFNKALFKRLTGR